MKRNLIVITIIIFIGFLVFIGFSLWRDFIYTPPEEELDGGVAQGYKLEYILNGLNKPWDIEIDSEGTIFFTQRSTGLYVGNMVGEYTKIYTPSDLVARGEGGMLGLVLSNDFQDDRTLFLCYNRQDDIVVEKVIYDQDITKNEYVIDSIPTAQSGRHSGCRLDIDEEGYLWVTTGDAADGNNPQDLKSLGGKILRVDIDGKGHPDNPFNEEENTDSRIYSYGHRNVQGIVLMSEPSERFGYGFSTEHGPRVNDEINPLIKGNFGWDPDLPYDESVPMTDKEKFPDALLSAWDSGERTIAISEIEYVEGELYPDWEGSFLVAALKDSYILRFEIDDESNLLMKEQVVNDQGRIRDIHQAPDGYIYFSTDNGGDEDVVVRIVPD